MLSESERWRVTCADNLEWMRGLPTGCCSLAVTSPPYESQRLYGVGFKLEGQAWVDWMIPRVVEMCRVVNGLVCVNMSAPRRDEKASPAVEWLVSDLTRHHGLVMGPAPYCYFRFGIPGSGRPNYHRRDHEPVYCFARPECIPLAWSDPTATGHKPRWAPGGEMSNRLKDGQRVNPWTNKEGMPEHDGKGGPARKTRHGPSTRRADEVAPAPSPGLFGEAEEEKPVNSWNNHATGAPPHTGTGRKRDGSAQPFTSKAIKDGVPPGTLVLANAGNVVREKYCAETVRQLLESFATREVEYGDVIRCMVGGGQMGDSRLAHASEAPFSETLVEFFVKSYCPPGGILLDPFVGSGTSGCVAIRLGRRFLGADIRESQVQVARVRIARETPDLFAKASSSNDAE